METSQNRIKTNKNEEVMVKRITTSDIAKMNKKKGKEREVKKE